jgi:hypothetical protein
MKKFLILALVLGLSVALLGPASAVKKKKKAPKPFVAEFTVELGHTVQNGNSGTLVAVTGQEFLNTCAVPTSNGFDGFVVEVPEALRKTPATVEASGTSATDAASPADMDMYFFDESCEPTGLANAPGTDEFGAILPGTVFIFVHNYVGGPTDAKLVITPTK